MALRAGSSPLARGLRRRRPADQPGHRIIPARAGFTALPCWRGAGTGDHPRSRGVYRYLGATDSEHWGSSPLARGLRRGRLRGELTPGIIPARAGFTHPRTSGSRSCPDHPRSRGVYGIVCHFGPSCQGSSPLARGLRLSPSPGTRSGGIIPARAGFTPWTTSPGTATPDHPRSRGVYRGGGGPCAPGEGSSPLARGLLTSSRLSGWRTRIIPARAGFTHPAADDPETPRGSSPLARGLPVEWETINKYYGIIPARAGFTLPH